MNALLQTIRFTLSALLLCVGGMLSSTFGQGISSLSPLSISAGTGSELVIEGSGFGGGPQGSQFYVEFPRADDGGASYLVTPVSGYILWSDTKIIVRVPSGAGTGIVRVNSPGLVMDSPQELTVSYNISGADNEARRHISRNATGGYTIQYENNFNANPSVRNSFNKALKTWACVAGMNWQAGEVTDMNRAGRDGVNIARFDTGGELPDGVLGVAYTYSVKCSSNEWEIEEIDIVFDKETNWNYGEELPGPLQYDFQSVVTHELGHAHNLGHVIDRDDLMHYALAPGKAQRELSVGNKEGASYQMGINTHQGGGSCSTPISPVVPESCPFPFPVIHSLSSSEAGKGETVMISGKYLTETTEVSFGDTPASSFRIVSDELIEATLGIGFTGEVAVTTPGGIVYFGGFKFIEDPVLFSFSPSYGYTGDKIVLTGNHLQSAISVSFGGVPAASFQIVDDRTIEAVLGGGASGDITVSTGRAAVTIEGFIFTSEISVSSVSPMEGKTGDIITIGGSNFSSINSVKFGGMDAESFWLESGTEIKAVLGKGNRGSITIASDYGTASFDDFFFLLAPQISKFTPLTAVSGTPVMITGENLEDVEEVFFGGEPATSFSAKGTSSITAIVGTGTSGAVSVKTKGGTASRDGFTFIETLAISSFAPKTATTDHLVVIKGIKFRNVIGVSFGGVPAKSFTVDSPGSITAVVGSGASGDVTVRTAEGAVSLPDFKFLLPPTLSYFNPSTAGAGTVVSISGTNLSEVTSVKFGGVEAASFRLISDSHIEAIVAKGADGKISVASIAGVAEIGSFVFVPAPMIDRIDAAKAGEGTLVNIYGKNLSTAREIIAGDRVAASFQVISSTQLSIIIAPGASGHGIKVSTLGGTAVYDNFRVIRLPVIEAFSPQNAIAGTEVLFSGKNFGDVTAVNFGGVPASSFSILSDSRLSAKVAQASRSGQVSLVNAAGIARAGGFSFKFTLPADNFSVLATDLTCKGSLNGSIKLHANTRLNYTATLSGGGVRRTAAFTDDLELMGLAAGNYSLCITVEGEGSFLQCFEVVIREPADLSLYAAVDSYTRTLDLKMSGGENYFVELNGHVSRTSSDEMSLDLLPGTNKLRLYTDRFCQGVIERTFELGNSISVFPNPFETLLKVTVPENIKGTVNYDVMDAGGRTVYSGSQVMEGNVLALDLSGLISGAYLIRLSTGDWRAVQRILKK